MKIGFVIDDTLDSTDGVQQYVLAVGKWLIGQGHEVHYLAGQTARTDLPHVHSLSRNIKMRFNGNRMSVPLPASYLKITQLLGKEQFDVLHVQMPYSPLMAGRVIKAAPRRTRLIGTFHTLPLGRLAYLGTWILAHATRRTTRRLHKVVSVSAPAQRFAASLGIRSDILPNVVDHAAFAAGKPLTEYQDKRTIVFLGRLVERKGCAQLLNAVALLLNHHPELATDLQLLICGTGPYAAALQAQATAAGIAELVTFTGYLSEDAKADYLATADVAVFPSLGGESFGIVLLEAMAAGAGVTLGGNNPGYASVLSDVPETLFGPTDTQAFAELLAGLLKNDILRRKLHRRQQALVRQYEVAKVGTKLLSYYQASKHKG